MPPKKMITNTIKIKGSNILISPSNLLPKISIANAKTTTKTIANSNKSINPYTFIARNLFLNIILKKYKQGALQ